MPSAALQALGRQFGIAPTYTDQWGTTHVVSETTLRALLGAMGVDAATSEKARTALVEAQANEWRRLLPPVSVVRTGTKNLEIMLRLPARAAGECWRWTLREESGRPEQAEFVPDSLAPGDTCRIDDEAWEERCLVLPRMPQPGYHELMVSGAGLEASMRLIVAPSECYRPEAVRGERRAWGMSLQLFALRSSRNWGLGDFTDLARAVELAAREGAGVVGVNPLHALFPRQATRCSPYSPSNRLFLNILYIDVEAVPDCSEAGIDAEIADPAFQARLRALRAGELIDYAAVGHLKLELLERLYNHFRSVHLANDTTRARHFQEFRRRHDPWLRRHALFEALQEHLEQQRPDASDWRDWPAAFRTPEADEVTTFAQAHEPRVTFYEYLQWQAALQLDAAGRRALELGLEVGIYEDLAVSVDPGGSEAWANHDRYAFGARIGAPPDDFNLQGQDWGIAPWIPHRLRTACYAPFIETLRQNMRAAGALRIDHVMGLYRLFWLPPDGGPEDGAYVHFHMEEMLGIVALESRRNRCMVVGEDLGTVPEAIQEALPPAGIFSCRVMYFEKQADGAFLAPAEYPPRALASVGTHDLPTLRGFWEGADLEWRRRLDLFPDAASYETQVVGRAQDRARLRLALEREGLRPGGPDGEAGPAPELDAALCEAIHVYLARTPAKLMLLRPEDLLGETLQTNLPGSGDRHPNWRHRLTLDIETWMEQPGFAATLAAVRETRGSAVSATPLPVSTGALPARAEIPRATYRLQLNRDFTLDDATALVPYLAALGISHCYTSPLLKARPGSPHGYDIVAHDVINDELGGEAAFARFTDALRAHGLGLLMDIVPNHMGVMGRDNPWWLDVLEHGRASRYARFFDIDWRPLKDELRGKVLLPVLGDHYGNILDRGELQIVFDRDSGALSAEYFEHRFPLDPAEYPRVFAHRRDDLAARLGAGHASVGEFDSLLTAFANLPPRHDDRPDAVEERSRDTLIHKRRLAALYAQDVDVAQYLEDTLADFNGTGQRAGNPAVLHALLETQGWRLAYWRVAADEINYRRFFDINELAALSMERREVFDATHRRVFELLAAGSVQGLRVDHPDGLYDPAGYFDRLQDTAAVIAKRDVNESKAGHTPHPRYVVVEKILAADEALPEHWPVHGTTGYEFVRSAGGLFVDRASAETMNEAYHRFTGAEPFDATVQSARRQIMEEALASELAVLATELARIAEMDTHTRDFTRSGLRQAIENTVACFGVYRTYIDANGPSATDEARIAAAIDAARRSAKVADDTIYDFLRDVLLTRQAAGREEDYRARILAFAMKFQQFTSPVAAKGVEDTAFYRFNRLVSLNEVGGEPAEFGHSPRQFHRDNEARWRHWPHSLLAGSTHDAKRSLDASMRIHALSEHAGDWTGLVEQWMRANTRFRQVLDSAPAPVANDEYLLYQTLIGAWPNGPTDETARNDLVRRIQAYMVKALREAKQRTSWTRPDIDYEAAMERFIASILDPASPFLETFLPFQKTVARTGRLNSLAYLLLELTSPGVPDLYQGDEFWQFLLVDPDNRRPVDFARRQAALDALQSQSEGGPLATEDLGALLMDDREGRSKLYLVWRLLTLRRRHTALFREGDYIALETSGAQAGRLCAFCRRRDDAVAVSIVPRLAAHLPAGKAGFPLGDGAWKDTFVRLPDWLSGEQLHDILGGGTFTLDGSDFPAGRALERFPVALWTTSNLAD